VTDDQRSPEEIREDIEQTREELGDTAAAFAQKADVKEQAKAKASAVKRKATDRADSVKQSAAAKKEEVAAKAQAATPESASSAVHQAQRYAKENPAAVAAGAAFLAGFVLGRRRSRR
jgi:ElaB/YqjD/DUF883 family membrane-anchored ribosome-binding protein